MKPTNFVLIGIFIDFHWTLFCIGPSQVLSSDRMLVGLQAKQLMQPSLRQIFQCTHGVYHDFELLKYHRLSYLYNLLSQIDLRDLLLVCWRRTLLQVNCTASSSHLSKDLKGPSWKFGRQKCKLCRGIDADLASCSIWHLAPPSTFSCPLPIQHLFQEANSASKRNPSGSISRLRALPTALTCVQPPSQKLLSCMRTTSASKRESHVTHFATIDVDFDFRISTLCVPLKWHGPTHHRETLSHLGQTAT